MGLMSLGGIAQFIAGSPVWSTATAQCRPALAPICVDFFHVCSDKNARRAENTRPREI